MNLHNYFDMPNIVYSFENKIDAYDYTLGTIHTQHGHLISYNSKTFNDMVQFYSTYEKYLYDIVQAIE